jgi:hypothetical protein
MPSCMAQRTCAEMMRAAPSGFPRLPFTVCFAVWTVFSIIGVQIKKDLGLTDPQFGLLVGTPLLAGAIVRVPLGIWTDQLKPTHMIGGYAQQSSKQRRSRSRTLASSSTIKM